MNPYNCTEPGHLFVGRKLIRHELLEGFRNGHSYALLGGRRCGKTSLLMQIEKDLTKDSIPPFRPIPIRISVQEFAGNHPAMLFKRFFPKKAQGKLIEDIDWAKVPKELVYPTMLKQLDRIASVIKQVFGPDWLVVLLMDELEAAVKISPDDIFFQNLRHFLMESPYHRHFRLVATGVKHLAGLIFSGSSPLNNLRHEYLGILEEEAAIELIQHGFPTICDNEPDLREVLALTGKHPYVLQGVLEKLWSLKPGHDAKSIRQATRKFLKQHSDFRNWFDAFSQAEREAYRLLAQAQNGKLSIDDIQSRMSPQLRPETDDAITTLSYHGIIDDSDEDEIKIAGTLFRDWFLKVAGVDVGVERGENEKQKSEGNMQVFISYAKDDAEIARKLYVGLKSHGITPWMESEDLLAGQNKKQTIRQAIKSSQYFLALLSHNSLTQRGFVQKELKIALDLLDEFPENETFVIPVRLEKCEPQSEALEDIYPVDLFPSYEDGFQKIMRALQVSEGPNSTVTGGNAAPDSTNPAPMPTATAPPHTATHFDPSRTIKILFLAANPTDDVRLRLDAEIRSIDQALRNAQFRDRFDLQQQWAVRVGDLQGLIMRHDPDIVHFSGHGSKYSEIILENNGGDSQAVPSHALSAMFSLLKGNIHCVVLNACYSAGQAEAISTHIDHVIGMSDAIGDNAAISFSSAFYQALGYGRDVPTAFQLGCVQIDMDGLAEGDKPKLLLPARQL